MGKKRPKLQFDTSAWLADENLSACSPSTRGIWIDLLCAIHAQRQNGSLTGTLEQLARLSRCTPDECHAALVELRTSNAADIQEENGFLIVINRRMRREQAPKGEKRTNTLFLPPAVEEVAEYCAERKNGVDAQKFVDFYSAKGWMVGKSKMKDWKAAVRTWEQRQTGIGGTLTPLEAWGIVQKYLDYRRKAERDAVGADLIAKYREIDERLQKMHPEVLKAIRAFGVKQLQSGNADVVRGQFLRSFGK